jgi:hypothetical protein
LAVLHPPYTAWHLSYVLIGAGIAPHLDGRRLAGTVVAFALAVGIAAHALDEIKGRPLRTGIPAGHLLLAAGVSLLGAAVVGGFGISEVGWPLAVFVGLGVILVVAYNLELAGGRLHNAAAFAAAWGAFPVLTAYYAQTSTIRPAAAVAAVYAYALSAAQHRLSTEARHIRRRTVSAQRNETLIDGSVATVGRDQMLEPLEATLRNLAWATCAVGVALVIAHA